MTELLFFQQTDMYFNFLAKVVVGWGYKTQMMKKGASSECETPDGAVKGLDGFSRNRWDGL